MNTAFLTGATSGMGTGLALALADRVDHLILHGRDAPRLAELAERVRPRTGGVTTLLADLSDPVAVLELCGRIRGMGRPLDLIINNAAVGGGKDPAHRETNRHGTELRMAANVIGPHLIARRLRGTLTPTGRIVQVGSAGQAALAPADLDFSIGYDGVQAYLRSKLALIMDSIDLAAEGVWVNVVHPADRMPTRMVQDSGLSVVSTIDDGVLPVLRLALDSELAGVRGRYFARFEQREPHPQAADPIVRKALQDWISAQVRLAVRPGSAAAPAP